MSLIKVSLEKYRQITKNRLRVEREPLFAALDVAYQRADETGDTVKKAEVASEKQRLRNITNLADQATTLDELKALEIK